MCLRLRGTRWLLPSRSPVPTTMMIVAVMVAIAVIVSLMATSTRNAIEGLGKMSSCLEVPEVPHRPRGGGWRRSLPGASRQSRRSGEHAGTGQAGGRPVDRSTRLPDATGTPLLWIAVPGWLSQADRGTIRGRAGGICAHRSATIRRRTCAGAPGPFLQVPLLLKLGKQCRSPARGHSGPGAVRHPEFDIFSKRDVSP